MWNRDFTIEFKKKIEKKINNKKKVPDYHTNMLMTQFSINWIRWLLFVLINDRSYMHEFDGCIIWLLSSIFWVFHSRCVLLLQSMWICQNKWCQSIRPKHNPIYWSSINCPTHWNVTIDLMRWNLFILLRVRSLSSNTATKTSSICNQRPQIAVFFFWLCAIFSFMPINKRIIQ